MTAGSLRISASEPSAIFSPKCRPAMRAEPYGADMQMFVNHGATPCVIFGPGDVKYAHSADEFVPIDEVETCARVLAAWVLREIGGG